MSIPSYYDPNQIGKVGIPDLQSAVSEGLQARSQLGNAAKNRPHGQVALWLIDMQVDFVHPQGSLSVPGALEDARRLVEWMYQHAGVFTQIVASLDTHSPYQIFHPLWWIDQDGNHPQPFTEITFDSVRAGEWRPVISPQTSLRYLSELEATSRKRLMIWPVHCIDGTTGHSLLPAVAEAISYIAVARRFEPAYLRKGTISDTEYYSILEPEVKRPAHPDGGLNVNFLNMIANNDLVYIAGQARSHCVLETMNSIVNHFAGQPQVLQRIRFLDDCTSSIPGFEQPTEERIREFSDQGVTIVTTADPIA